MLGAETSLRQIGPIPAGMDNRAAEHTMPEGTARNVVNTDIDNLGRLRRRPGFTRVYSGLDIHSGFACEAGAFFVEAGNLKQLHADYTTTIVWPGVRGPVAHCFWNGVLYLSDGVVTKKLVRGELLPWGQEAPGPPILATTTGMLLPGLYVAALAFVADDGQEHQPSRLTTIRLHEPGGILFVGLPAGRIRLYLSTADGAVLYHVTDRTDGSNYLVADNSYEGGQVLTTTGITSPPAGNIIRPYAGRVYVADKKTVWYSEPFSPERFRRATNYLLFPDDVSLMEPVAGGIWFAAGTATWFYAGAPDADEAGGFQINQVFSYGAIAGTSARLPDGRVMWQSPRGAILAYGGEAKNVQEPHVAPDIAATGAGLFMEQDGGRKYLAALHQPQMGVGAIRSWMDAEIIRRKTI